MLNGIHHIALKTDHEKQFREVLHFYREVLGCAPVRAWGEGEDSCAMLDLGNTLLEVSIRGAAGQGGDRFAHIAFRTDDVDGAVDLVRAAGCPITVEPKNANLGGDYPIRVAFCIGPAGEEVEFFQEC